jgi:hypothetical protein
MSRSFCSNSAIKSRMRCLVSSSETARTAIWRYFMIFISSSTRSFLWGICAPDLSPFWYDVFRRVMFNPFPENRRFHQKNQAPRTKSRGPCTVYIRPCCHLDLYCYHKRLCQTSPLILRASASSARADSRSRKQKAANLLQTLRGPMCKLTQRGREYEGPDSRGIDPSLQPLPFAAIAGAVLYDGQRDPAAPYFRTRLSGWRRLTVSGH